MTLIKFNTALTQRVHTVDVPNSVGNSVTLRLSGMRGVSSQAALGTLATVSMGAQASRFIGPHGIAPAHTARVVATGAALEPPWALRGVATAVRMIPDALRLPLIQAAALALGPRLASLALPTLALGTALYPAHSGVSDLPPQPRRAGSENSNTVAYTSLNEWRSPGDEGFRVHDPNQWTLPRGSAAPPKVENKEELLITGNRGPMIHEGGDKVVLPPNEGRARIEPALGDFIHLAKQGEGWGQDGNPMVRDVDGDVPLRTIKPQGYLPPEVEHFDPHDVRVVGPNVLADYPSGWVQTQQTRDPRLPPVVTLRELRSGKYDGLNFGYDGVTVVTGPGEVFPIKEVLTQLSLGDAAKPRRHLQVVNGSAVPVHAQGATKQAPIERGSNAKHNLQLTKETFRAPDGSYSSYYRIYGYEHADVTAPGPHFVHKPVRRRGLALVRTDRSEFLGPLLGNKTWDELALDQPHDRKMAGARFSENLMQRGAERFSDIPGPEISDPLERIVYEKSNGTFGINLYGTEWVKNRPGLVRGRTLEVNGKGVQVKHRMSSSSLDDVIRLEGVPEADAADVLAAVANQYARQGVKAGKSRALVELDVSGYSDATVSALLDKTRGEGRMAYRLLNYDFETGTYNDGPSSKSAPDWRILIELYFPAK